MRPHPIPTALVTLLAATAASAQSTWFVDAGGTPPGSGTREDPYTSIAYCVEQGTTLPGDEVVVAPGLYSETVALVDKPLAIRGSEGAAATIVEAHAPGSVFSLLRCDGARLEGLTVRLGTGTAAAQGTTGGGVSCDDTDLELVDCVVEQNEATVGGGLYVVRGSSLWLSGSTLSGNTAQYGGGLYAAASDVEIVDCRFDQNALAPAPAGLPQGGGLCVAGPSTLTLQASTVTGNGSTDDAVGGGIHLGDGVEATIDGCTISGNEAGYSHGSSLASQGGGVYSQAQVVVLGSTVADNRAFREGGGWMGPGELHDCVISSNRAYTGAGISGASLLVGCLITGNQTIPANGVCGGSAGGVKGGVLQACTLTSNLASLHGGGAGGAVLTDCVVSDNWAGVWGCGPQVHSGGGLYNCSAEACVIKGNRVDGGDTGLGKGGGAAQSTLVDCLLGENRAASWADSGFELVAMGGGAWSCTLTDCTLRGNIVGTTGTFGLSVGGGMHMGTATRCWFESNCAGEVGYFGLGGGAAAATVTHSVFVQNEAHHGGAAWKAVLQRCTLALNTAHDTGGAVSGHPAATPGAPGSASTLIDCISWENAPDELDPDTGLITATYSDVRGGYPGLGNIDADPRFWSLAARDFHLRADSPCIDAGDPLSPPDPDGSVADMGAFAFDPDHCGAPEVYCAAKESSLGCTPAISFTGAPTLSGDDDFFVTATQIVNQRPGIMIWGTSPAELPLFGGTLCVAAPIVRTGQQGSGGSAGPGQDCSGSFAFHFSQAYAADKGLVAGDRLYAQYWYRDPGHADGTGAGLTDALDFTLCP